MADKRQRCTQTYVRRPYGVGLWWRDATPHPMRTDVSVSRLPGSLSLRAPSDWTEPSRPKLALEKHHKTFKDAPVEEVCTHV